jgi:hypothetical protein
MRRHVAVLAALFVVGATVATAASARDSFAVSIGVPGFGVGYSTRGYGYAYAAPPVAYPPPVAYSPPVAYAAPYPYYGPAPVVVYAGPYGRYYHPYWRARYWHRR